MWSPWLLDQIRIERMQILSSFKETAKQIAEEEINDILKITRQQDIEAEGDIYGR